MNNDKKLKAMRFAGKINLQAIEAGFTRATIGTSLQDIDEAIETCIVAGGCTPAFKGYRGFPGTACLSVNDGVVHGIPNDYVLQDGDLLTIDVGSKFEGFFVDAARSRVIPPVEGGVWGSVHEGAQYLIDATEYVLDAELAVIRDGCTLLDIALAAEAEAARGNVTIMSQWGGHQIGKEIHMDPFIPNAIDRGKSSLGQDCEVRKYQALQLKSGQTICIEPVVTYGSTDIIVDSDGWTIRSKDKALVAHTERCMLVTEQGYELLS